MVKLEKGRSGRNCAWCEHCRFVNHRANCAMFGAVVAPSSVCDSFMKKFSTTSKETEIRFMKMCLVNALAHAKSAGFNAQFLSEIQHLVSTAGNYENATKLDLKEGM